MDHEIPVTEARSQFSDLVNRVGFGKERIVLTRHGRPLVALVPAETLDRDERETVTDITTPDGSSLRGLARRHDLPIAAQHPASPSA